MRALLPIAVCALVVAAVGCVAVPVAAPATPPIQPAGAPALVSGQTPEPTPSPAPTTDPMAAEPGPDWVAYRSEAYAVALGHPPGWRERPDDRGVRVEGPDGFVWLDAVGAPGTDLDVATVAAMERAALPYGRAPTVVHLTVDGRPARAILPSDDVTADGKDAAADRGLATLLVAYPRPVTVDGAEFAILALHADPDHIGAIARTVTLLEPPPSAEEGPQPEALLARARDLLAEFGRDVGAPFTEPVPHVFTWHVEVPGADDARPADVDGWRIAMDGGDASTHEAVVHYLTGRGLVADRWNVAAGTVSGATGYRGEGLACLVVESAVEGAAPAVAYRQEVFCGPLPPVPIVTP